MDNDGRYWKCEYENLRRKKQKQIDAMILAQSKFANKTYDLLKALGMTDEQIQRWYRNESNN